MRARGVLAFVALIVVPTAWAGADGDGGLTWVEGRSAEGGRLQAVANALGLEASLGGDGLRVEAAGGEWELRLVLARLGREGALAAAEPAMPWARGARAELDRDDVVEWWVSTEQGLEHGFTVRERPEGLGALVLEIELGGDLAARPEASEGSVALVRPGSPLAVLHYGGLEVKDAEGEPMPASLAPAPGNGGALHIVIDDGGATYPLVVDPLLTTATWFSAENDSTFSVAWGDWDSDGDLDLAVGDDLGPIRVYENDGGVLSSAWSSSESETTASLAWGDWDGDGDLDLVASNAFAPIRVYENEGGTLVSGWTSTDSDHHRGSTLGDWDGDGDLDLATSGYNDPVRVYVNGVVSRPGGLPETPASPVIADRPGITDVAFFHSSEECLSSPVTIAYTLTDEESDPARLLVAEYSESGGGSWAPATVTWIGGNEDVPALPEGSEHTLEWDVLADQLTLGDSVVFRITVPHQASMRLAGPVQRGAMAATSPPFRVCDDQLAQPIFADGFESGDTTAWE